MKMPKGMGDHSPEEPKKSIKPEIVDPVDTGMSLSEYEDTPPELRAGIKDPYYTEETDSEDAFVDEEWDGHSEGGGYITGDALGDEKLRERLRKLMELKSRYKEKEAIYHPERFGLPDFLREPEEGETLVELKQWRRDELYRFMSEDLYAVKGGRKIQIKVTPVMLNTVYDVLYKVHNKFIIHKGRGCGGSFCVGIIAFLVLIYHHREVVNMAGCLLPDELVQTSMGYTPIKDVKIGDSVTSLAGAIAEVTDWIEKDWDGDVTHLVAKGYGDGITYTSDHQLLVVKNSFPYTSGKKVDYSSPLGEVSWHPIGDLTENDGLAIPLPKQHGELPKIQYGLPSSSAQRWATNPALECAITPDHCRFLGYWLAEGHIDQKVGQVVMSFGESDEFLGELALLTKELFNRDVTLERNLGENGNEVRYRMGNKVLAQWITRTFGTGASTKTIPLEFLDALPDDHLFQLLIGFIRGDGSYSLNSRGKTTVNLATSSKGLASAFHRLCLRLKLFPNITVSKRGKEPHHKDMWILTFSGDDGYNLANQCFPDTVHVKAKNVRNKQHKFTATHVVTKVKSVETRPYIGKVYDITVPKGTSFGVPMGHAHNSKKQASHIYEYVTSFWDCFPKFKRAVLADDPLLSKTELKTGAQLECITCSESAARGDHPSCLIIDEACQGTEKPEGVMKSAAQSVASEPDPLVLMLSTFHHPVGLFQEYWDMAEEKGYHKVKWDVFDAMQPCRKGMETATVDDPQALNYCKNVCPFSWTKEDRAPDGTLKGVLNKGCHGKARTSTGFMHYDQVMEAYKENRGTQIFEIEFGCERPEYAGTIYAAELVDPCKADFTDIELPEQYEVSVGVDWGFVGQTAIVVCIYTGTMVYIVDSYFVTGKSVDEVVGILLEINSTYGDFTVYADESHPFNNAQLEEVGFNVARVNFKTWKEIGISNIQRYLMSHKIKIDKYLTTLLEQMKGYKRNKLGKPLKKDDHGPDALCAGMLGFFFPELFPDELFSGDDEFMRKVELLRGKIDGSDDGSVTIL